jgi:hypothetical protein
MSTVHNSQPTLIHQPQNFFSESISKVGEGMSILGKGTVEQYPDHFFSNSSTVLSTIAKALVIQTEDTNNNLSDIATMIRMSALSPNDQSYSIDAREIVNRLGAKAYFEASTKKLAERYIHSLSKEDLEIFNQRIAKVWKEKTFSKKDVDAQFGQKFLQEQPENSIITTAIEESNRASLIQLQYTLLQSISSDESLAKTVKEMYQALPEKDRFAIEGLVWKHRSEKTQDPEFGKHYLERLFRDKNIDFAPFANALKEYLESRPLSLEPNFNHSCDESSHPPFFKIQDEKGKTCGYILGTYHSLLKEDCRFPRKLRHAFFKSKVIAFETRYEREFTNNYQREKSKAFSINNHPFRLVEVKLAHKARALGKAVVPLELDKESKKTLETVENFMVQNGEPTLKDHCEQVLSNASLAEEKFRNLYRQGESWKQGDFESSKLDFMGNFLYISGHSKNEIQDIIANKDFEKLNKLFLDLPPERKEQFKRVMTDRDIVFSNRIDSLLKSDSSGRVFNAIGLAHLSSIGDFKGVLDLLKEKGWTIIQA